MSAYSEFFLHTSPNIVELDLLEISHPNFSQTYRLVRNACQGVSVTHEDASGPHLYTFVPMSVQPLGSSLDLDQQLEVTVGDLGSLLPAELSLVAAGNGFQIKPSVVYRTYRSDDLTLPLFGPVVLQADGISFNKEGAVFKARAAAFNVTRTGEVYSLDRFPMLEPLA